MILVTPLRMLDIAENTAAVGGEGGHIFSPKDTT